MAMITTVQIFYFYVYLTYLLINQLSSRLTRVTKVNVPLLQGLGVSMMYIKPDECPRPIRVGDIHCIIVRSESSVLFSSSTRVNCHIKTGSLARVIFWVLDTFNNKEQ